MIPRSVVRERGGFTLAELLIAAGAGGVLLAAAFAALGAFARLARAHHRGLDAAEATRVAALVLSDELRLAAPADIAGLSADTVALRAPRGFGVVCATGSGSVFVRYRGMRDPEPAKDSVLVPGGAPEPAAALERDRAAPGACPPEASAEVREWALSAAIAFPGTPLLLFERGAYHLAGGALRYRRGSAGRQPLTDTLLGASSFFALDRGGGVFRARLDAAPGGERTDARVRMWNWP